MSYLHVAVDEKQLAGWKAAAKGRDLSLSVWVRMTLDREVGTRSVWADDRFRVENTSMSGTRSGGVFAPDCPGTHMAGVRCDGCGGSKW